MIFTPHRPTAYTPQLGIVYLLASFKLSGFPETSAGRCGDDDLAMIQHGIPLS
jgi:hypothetical protein